MAAASAASVPITCLRNILKDTCDTCSDIKHKRQYSDLLTQQRGAPPPPPRPEEEDELLVALDSGQSVDVPRKRLEVTRELACCVCHS